MFMDLLVILNHEITSPWPQTFYKVMTRLTLFCNKQVTNEVTPQRTNNILLSMNFDPDGYYILSDSKLLIWNFSPLLKLNIVRSCLSPNICSLDRGTISCRQDQASQTGRDRHIPNMKLQFSSVVPNQEVLHVVFHFNDIYFFQKRQITMFIITSIHM